MKRKKIDPEEERAVYRDLLIDLCRENGYRMYENFAGEQLLTVRVYTEVAYRCYRGDPGFEDPYKFIYNQILYQASLKTVKVV